ncbi:hypothetical protein AN639_06440 [Candidatus Epulonipiscium fishelsonii]|uniref:Uncharacterized protein n=1 Tax=Candidatus Epulonipiscium fishelsonii TaxID=77094 RepID=A0ACC8XAS9_9FIRM|nr:hypothetical protein AN639_06440 [Epulopiscium sp. SCG-B05WGA-EpuloA1]ONI39452.1 hypothetical protein AN396_08595 [Epulopiscium sp. SCG-B11WGA-EpuloA1]
MTKDYLKDLIRIDTQNYKSNETELVNYISKFCDNNNIRYEIFYKDENRKNIIISLGPETDQNLIVVGHMDVVVANPEDWELHPFEGKEKDGYLYGRGAVDMKYVIASSLSIIEELKRQEDTLERGINFVFTSDEENGSEYGMEYLITQDRAKKILSNKKALNEGGGFSFVFKDKLYYLYETGQKTVARVKVSIKKNEKSNPFFPDLENEATLVKVIRKVEAIKFDVDLPYTTKKLLAELTGDSDINSNNLLEKLSVIGDKGIVGLLRAMSENYQTASMIKGGNRNKHLGKTVGAEAIFDVRLLPNITEECLAEKLKETLRDLPVEIEIMSFMAGFEAEVDENFVGLLERALKDKNPRIEALLPFITPGSNDGKFLKELNTTVYGFAPLCEKDYFVDVLKGIHSINERILVESIEFNKEVMQDIIVAYCRRRYE